MGEESWSRTRGPGNHRDVAAFPRFLTDLYRKGREDHLHHATNKEETETMSKNNKPHEK